MADAEASVVAGEPRFQKVAIALDEAINAALMPDMTNITLAADPHATISAVLGQMITEGTPEQKDIATVADKLLTWIQVNGFGQPVDVSHCVDAYVSAIKG